MSRTRGATAMRVELKTVGELQPADLRAWSDLAATVAEPNPFFEPAFLNPALRHLAVGRDVVVLVFVYDGPELVWVAPIACSSRWRRLRLSSVTIWCHTHCFFGAPLVADDRAEAAWRLVLDTVATWRPKARLLILELLPTDGEVFRSLQRASDGRTITQYETYTRATLERASLVDDTLPQRGRHRRELERRSRLVERETGAPFDTREVSDEPGSVEAFLDLEKAGWTGRAGTALASDPDQAAFAREAARAFEDEGRLVLLATEAGTGVAAALFAVRSGGTLFMFKIAFDEQLARFSPGTHLVRDMTRWFAEDPNLDRIDSCAVPENEFINRLLPDRRPLATVLVSMDRGLGAMAAALLPTLVNFRRRLPRPRNRKRTDDCEPERRESI